MCIYFDIFRSVGSVLKETPCLVKNLLLNHTYRRPSNFDNTSQTPK